MLKIDDTCAITKIEGQKSNPIQRAGVESKKMIELSIKLPEEIVICDSIKISVPESVVEMFNFDGKKQIHGVNHKGEMARWVMTPSYRIRSSEWLTRVTYSGGNGGGGEDG